MAAAIPRFIQLLIPLPPLKLMDQLRLGVAQFLESQAHLLAMIILRFTQVNMPLPPLKPMDQLRFGVKQI
jgi:hypothetical protein